MASDYLLALDLGTSSIGYAVFETNEREQPVALRDTGVRIFPDGRDPKTKVPLAVERRIARGVRRTRDRGQNRVRRLVKELIECGLLPSDEDDRKRVFAEVCPYEARTLSVSGEVTPFTLGRALFHLGRRRGFKSNRLSDDDDDETAFKAKIAALKEVLGDKTLGQYLHAKLEANKELVANKQLMKQQVVRFRVGETDFYASRSMYQDEFDRIKKQQGYAHLSDIQWAQLEETIFFQYPLRPVPKGKCRFYPEETRAHIDLPITHQFRILQEVNSLRYMEGGEMYSLDSRQRREVTAILETQKSVTFKGLAKKKDKNGAPLFPSGILFNLDVDSRAGKLSGNSVMVDLRKPELMGQVADLLDITVLNDVVSFLIEPVVDGQGRQKVLDTEEVEAWLHSKALGFTANQCAALSKYRFKRGTASVSRKFIEQINPILRETDATYDKAVKQMKDGLGNPLHHSHFISQEFDELPYYALAMPESVWGERPEADISKLPHERDEDAFLFGKIANPTVHVALNQLRVVVNQIIRKQGGKPKRIHIELARELKNSKKLNDKISKEQAANRNKNDKLKKIMQEEFGIQNPSRDDFQKMKLWEELGSQGARLCVFTGNAISARQLFNGEVEVEHIIPFSRCYDDGMSNKTLAFKSINNRKLNKTPDEAFSEDEYKAIVGRAQRAFGNTSKYRRFLADAFDDFYGGDQNTMLERQLNDTRYISRKAKQYLNCVCPDNKIVVVTGQMTAVLRNVWQLNRFKDREEGHYRDDHRHHIVDAFVVGLTSRWLIRQIMTRRRETNAIPRNLYKFLENRAPSIDMLKEQLNDHLERVVASYKPDHSKQGGMFYDTAYGIHTNKDGKAFLLTRKKVTDLSFAEVFQISGGEMRSALIKFLMDGDDIDTNALKIRECTKQLKAKVGNEKALFEKLQRFALKRGIRSLRIVVQNDSVEPVASAPYKGYALANYAYCDVWQIHHKQDSSSGRWSYRYQGCFVPFAKVKKYAKAPKRPESPSGRPYAAAKRIMRLYKNDTVELIDQGTGESHFMRVAGYSTTQNKLDLQLNLAAVSAGRNYVSINQVFHKWQVRRVPKK